MISSWSVGERVLADADDARQLNPHRLLLGRNVDISKLHFYFSSNLRLVVIPRTAQKIEGATITRAPWMQFK